MIEALEAIKELKQEARAVDALIIKDRVGVVQRNVQQVEGKYRSDNYVRRLAGLSNDVYRKSRNEAGIEWFGVTAFEDRANALRVQALWESAFALANLREPYIMPDFWGVEEEVDALLSKVRHAHLVGNLREERHLLMQLRDRIDMMLRMTNSEIVPAEMRTRV